MAEAQIAMGGNVDATTAALIRQIDAAQQVGNEMRRAANEGAQGWLNSRCPVLSRSKQDH